MVGAMGTSVLSSPKEGIRDMKTIQKVLWVAAFLASEALLSGCKSGWWFRHTQYRHELLPLIPPHSKVYIRQLPTTPIKPPVTKPEDTPWGPVLEPVEAPPALAPIPLPPNKPSSLQRQIKRAAGEVLA